MTWINAKDEQPPTEPAWKGGPNSSEQVMIFNGNWVTIGRLAETYKKRSLRWEDIHGRCTLVTHWMPLPEPPKRG